MRDLILLRHAEAMQVAGDGSDRDRPLSLRGEEEARAAGVWLQAQGAAPDAVLCSPARRAQMTVERVMDVLGPYLTGTPLTNKFLPEIYSATPGELLALLESHAASARQTLLIGHNPGLEQVLALLINGRSGEARGMPPASIAWLECDESASIDPGSARLRAFWSP